MSKGIKLFRIRGIDIEIDFSWFIIAALITLSVSSNPTLQGSNLSEGLIFLSAVGITLVFFASLLLHELMHSLVSKARGIDVTNIRLFFLGGVSNIKQEPRSGLEEFLIAIVGPLTSAVLGGAFFGLSFLVGPDAGLWAWAFGYLGYVNLALAIFNMIPAFPLDGGRVFRAITWSIVKDSVKATKVATVVSQIIAGLFIAGGVFLFLDGAIFDGLLIAMLGWYLMSAARQTYGQVLADKLLKDVPVSLVMSRPAEVALPGAPVAQIVYEFFMAKHYPVVAVVENGYLVGLISERETRTIPPQEWYNRRAVDVMKRRQSLQVAYLNDDLEETVKKLAELGPLQTQTVMPVLNEEGYFVGWLTPQDVALFLQFRQRYGDKVMPVAPVQNGPQAGYYNGQTWLPQPTTTRPFDPRHPQNPYGDAA